MRKRILIVEDELLVQMVNKQMLEEAGYTIVGLASSFDEAVDFMKANEADLILMDIKLEGEKDGVDAINEIRKFSDVPVIYLTGNSDAHHYSRAKESGMQDFLIKPIDFKLLISTIRNLFNENGSV